MLSEREEIELKEVAAKFERQRDRLSDILDVIAGFTVMTPQTAHLMRDMAKVGIVEVMRAEGRTWLDRIRADRNDRADKDDSQQ